MTKKILIIILAFTLVACNEPYSELEKKYPANDKSESKAIESKTIVLTSQNYRPAYNYNGIANVKLDDGFIEIEVSIFLLEPVHIPKQAITGCKKTCFGKSKWNADILLGDDGIEVSFDLSSEVIDWCYDNDLPVITGKQKRDWMYNKKPLPSFNSYVQVDREEYDQQIHSSCMGY